MEKEFLEKIEKEFFGKRNHMVLPELLRGYYEQKEFELVYYFSHSYLDLFETTRFYKMMSLMEMECYEAACFLYKETIGDWLDLLHQHKVYWKHVILFALYFKVEIHEYYEDIINQYYDSELVTLYESLIDNAEIGNLKKYDHVFREYPIIKYIWSGKYKKPVLKITESRWKEWCDYNTLIQKNSAPMKCVYSDNIKIFSYKPNEVSPSMHTLTDGQTTIMLDCGCEINNDTIKRLPIKEILNDLNIFEVSGVFISHAHMDHYGSLNGMKNTKIYMTNDTRQTIRCVSPEISLENSEVIHEFSSVNIGGVEVSFIPNGHIVGSVLMDINWKNTKRIVYSGDFNTQDINTVKGLDINYILDMSDKKIDVLIIETTYGKKREMLPLKRYEKMFVSICLKMFKHGKKIFIPCFAIGRAQEVAMLLKENAEKNGVKILIDGMAVKITECYQVNSGKAILSKNISVCNSELETAEKIANNDIILASSGMMRKGSTSYRYIENIFKSNDLCIIKVGFIHQYEHVLLSVENRKNKNVELIDIPLSAHASYDLLIELIERLLPEYVVYVHGPGIHK